MGTLIKGMGADHVIWGSEAPFYGSPQWEIEAMRRLEIPEDIQQKHGFAPLGVADSMVKNAIFGLNSAKMFGLDLRTARGPISQDTYAQIREEYHQSGGFYRNRSNAQYGFVQV